MKNYFLLLVILMGSSVCNKEENETKGTYSSGYQDGIYEGISRSKYLSEPYYGKVNIEISDGWLTKVDFMIRDSALHEDFNGEYEKHFAGNPYYISQCRNDWKGVQSYPDSL